MREIAPTPQKAFSKNVKCDKLVIDWSIYLREDITMVATTVIAASEAKAKFSELLERTRRGEGFAITLHGEEVARLVPAKRVSLEDVQSAIAAIKSTRTTLNRPGQPKLRIKDLITEGRR